MIKKLAILGMAFAIFFSSMGCKPSGENSGGKAQLALSVVYNIAKSEFEVEEEVAILLFYATNVLRHDMRRIASLESNPDEAYKEYSTAEICAVSKEGAFTLDENWGYHTNPSAHSSCVAIKIIDDFCAENYPYKFAFSLEPNSCPDNPDEIILPRELFVGEYGEVLVILKFFKFNPNNSNYVGSICVFYKNTNGKITLSKYKTWVSD